MDKLKIVFGENSYFHVERFEAERIKKIINLHSDRWISLHDLAKRINSKRLPTEWTVLKLAGAKNIVLGNKILAKAPIVLIKKAAFTPRRNYGKKYLRPSIRIKLTNGDIHK